MPENEISMREKEEKRTGKHQKMLQFRELREEELGKETGGDRRTAREKVFQDGGQEYQELQRN